MAYIKPIEYTDYFLQSAEVTFAMNKYTILFSGNWRSEERFNVKGTQIGLEFL